MLDLKKLEEKLDLALANETRESLTQWLEQKRSNAFFLSLGEGTIMSITEVDIINVICNQKATFEADFNDVPCSQDNLMAA
jgi:hypothetical protein